MKSSNLGTYSYSFPTSVRTPSLIIIPIIHDTLTDSREPSWAGLWWWRYREIPHEEQITGHLAVGRGDAPLFWLSQFGLV